VNRWLLQFDVRAAKDQYVSERWDANARAEYLLRPDTEWPLSVDRGVWPSVFYLNFQAPIESCSTIEVDPEVEGLHYWLDLDSMRTHYETHRALAPDGVFVGVELLSEKDADVGTCCTRILKATSAGYCCTRPFPSARRKAAVSSDTMWRTRVASVA